MKDTLKPGMSHQQTITTTPDMGIVHLGPDAPRMYSTPAMIALMEKRVDIIKLTREYQQKPPTSRIQIYGSVTFKEEILGKPTRTRPRFWREPDSGRYRP